LHSYAMMAIVSDYNHHEIEDMDQQMENNEGIQCEHEAPLR